MDPPVLFRPGAAWQHRLRKGGPVLGAVEGHAYREGALTLEPGDRLFLHTDGMTDQRNAEGEFYDEERLFASVSANLDQPPAQMLDEVFAGVQRFGSGGRGDDMTAMLLEITSLKDSDATGPLLAQAARDRVDDRGLPGGEEPLKLPPPTAES